MGKQKVCVSKRKARKAEEHREGCGVGREAKDKETREQVAPQQQMQGTNPTAQPNQTVQALSPPREKAKWVG